MAFFCRGSDSTIQYFCLSQRTPCQIRQSQCHKFFLCRGQETGNAANLTSTRNRSRPCLSSGRRVKKLSIVASEGTSRNVLDFSSGRRGASQKPCRHDHIHIQPRHWKSVTRFCLECTPCARSKVNLKQNQPDTLHIRGH